MKTKPPIYVLDFDLDWKVFKILQDKLVQDSGPKPIHVDKVLWGILREKMIFCLFEPLRKGDMGLVL